MKFQIGKEAREALCRQAPEFLEIAQRVELPDFVYDGDLFHGLVRSVISQQLAVRAAAVIFGRVEQLLGTITAENLQAAGTDALRACGLSGRKVVYLQGIAEAVLSGALDLAALPAQSDAEIIAELVKLKGVGVWTAEMLLIFALGRKDVLSYNDLGIRRGLMTLHRLETLSEAEFIFYRQRYAPYGTLASLYLWRIKDGGLAIVAE